MSVDLNELLTDSEDRHGASPRIPQVAVVPNLKASWPADLPIEGRWTVRVIGVFDASQTSRLALVFIARVQVSHAISLKGSRLPRTANHMGAIVPTESGNLVPGGVAVVLASNVVLEMSGKSLAEALEHGFE